MGSLKNALNLTSEKIIHDFIKVFFPVYYIYEYTISHLEN
jgi:hypothetical protein